MTAYGYIRKSVVHDPARMLSPQTQEAAIRSLAAKHGDEDVVVLSDLDVSGKKDRTKRRGWDELLRAVEGGQASAVYAYSLSRFARSVSQLAEFFDLCDRQKVAVRIERDQIDTSTATGKLVGNVLASLAQFESDVASERVKDAFAAKRVRDPGWSGPGARSYGERPGEDPSVVVAAFREAGSFDGAARLLNARGFPARGAAKGGVWHGTTISGVVRRADPDAVSPATTRGAAAGRRNYRLARLLACGQCGHFMTPSLDRRRGEVRYYCNWAKVTPHGRAWVSEKNLIAAVRDEAQHVAKLFEGRVPKGSAEDEAKAKALDAKRGRILENYDDGLYDKASRDARLAEVAQAESTLSVRRWARHIELFPMIMDVTDEDGTVVKADSPGHVNDYLRRLFDRIVVLSMREAVRRGPSRQAASLSFEWRDPSLRAEAA
jgi:DNA invertase Pin-like site-specific DNA recombinase